MDERRKLRRRHLIYYLRVFNDATDEVVGHVIDIHTEGHLLISDHPLPIGHVFNLRMILPAEMNHTEAIRFDALSVWSRPDIIPEFYNTGFKFLDMDPGHTETIRQLIHLFGLQDIWD